MWFNPFLRIGRGRAGDELMMAGGMKVDGWSFIKGWHYPQFIEKQKMSRCNIFLLRLQSSPLHAYLWLADVRTSEKESAKAKLHMGTGPRT